MLDLTQMKTADLEGMLKLKPPPSDRNAIETELSRRGSALYHVWFPQKNSENRGLLVPCRTSEEVHEIVREQIECKAHNGQGICVYKSPPSPLTATIELTAVLRKIRW